MNLKEYFPFSNIRPNQVEVLEWIEEFLQSKKKFLILELPTGSGKSAIAMTAALYKKSAHITTANKVLQDQYLRDFKDHIKDLRGKPNYENCYDDYIKEHKVAPEKKRPCSPVPKSLQDISSDACEYHLAYDLAKFGPISSYNTAAFFAYSQVWKNLTGNIREILIADECHTLVSQLSNFVELSISLSQVQNYGLDASLPDYSSTEPALMYLLSLWKKILGREDDGVNVKSLPKISDIPIPNTLTDKKEIESFENFFRKLDNLIRILATGRIKFIVESERDKKQQSVIARLTFRPVVVKELAHEYCFQFAKKVILLSATILDVDTYCDMLGIDKNDMVHHSQGSLFPVANRPIFTRCIGSSLNMRNLEEELPKIASTISTILGHYKGHKGIIHGTTYKICSFLYEKLKDPRILFPKTASEQKEILEKHHDSYEPTVLLSPSMQEGVDLKDDSSRFQIIVKIPYPNLGDQIIKERMNIYSGYYDMQTCLSMVQSYGRSTRTETDWSHTFVLDGQFWRVVNQNRKILPQWFLEAIQN